MHRHHARRAGRMALATEFVATPEPRTIGVSERGAQLIAGKFLFSGLFVEGKNYTVWDIAEAYPDVADEIHGCDWLDDLVAVGDKTAQALAQKWVLAWMAKYGDGRSGGWMPGITGRRLIRWINHGPFLLRGKDEPTSAKFFQNLAGQTVFVARRWKTTKPGLHRFEALAGTVYASLSLQSLEHHAEGAIVALAQDCAAAIGPDGSIVTRQPEELLDILGLLNWTSQTLTHATRPIPSEISDAIARIVPTLRALRHADGSLARFHGGGEGVDGRLDAALFASGIKTLPKDQTHMGFARLAAGRTTLIADAAAPPEGRASAQAHASTLSFELTSGRRPLIVNCGSGARFGDEWRRASRATPSHSTMMIAGASSSHLGPKGRMPNGDELLTELPTRVQAEFSATHMGRKLELSHNGYQRAYGLTHARVLMLSANGRSLVGEDMFSTLGPDDQTVFDHALPQEGLPFVIRFHLHPEVKPAIDAEGTAVSLTLKSGEIWVLRHDGAAKLSLAQSVYLQNRQLKPVATQQVVLSGRAMAYATRVRWSLAKTPDTPLAVRDFAQADSLDAID
ncbi:putative heparinase superfamily protein [Yoonia maricola]|uniref:Putative heparinase superfamily protein n=2 Tax=Yoonia maricola TaxID=420999 RepID=A0A2M8W0Y7_9RHOB|nr:putative heparinase superfamily protein [Yoonia maricola]